MLITLRVILSLVRGRAVGHRRLLAAVIVGVILAVGLMSATEIYRNALRERGIDVELSRADKTELDLAVSVSGHGLASPGYDDLQALIDRGLTSIDPFLTGTTRTAISSTFFLTDSDTHPTQTSDLPRANLQFLAGIDQQITLDAGRFPGPDTTATSHGAPGVEVALSSQAAAAFDVSIGDTFVLHPFWRDDLPPVEVTVVGLIAQTDPEAEYWGRRTDYFFVDRLDPPTYMFFMPEETLRGAILDHIPDITARLETLAYFDLTAIDSGDAELLAQRLRSLERSIVEGVDRARMLSEMLVLLDTFGEREFFAQVPLLVMTLQIVAIVLYYLVMVAALLVDRQATEVALLKSRGAGARHVLGIYVLEGLILAGIGLAVGPPLAAGVVSLLGLTPAFDGLSGGGLLDTKLTGAAYAWAALGAGLAFLALLVPVLGAARRSIVQQRQALSRPSESAFHRYYLDLVVVVVAALLFFQLESSDSLVTEELFGDLSYNPLLLLAPAVFLVTVAVVFLRLFPLVVRVVDGATARFNNTPLQLGLWQLMRAPLGHSRLVLLLILATAIGMFAATFGATLDRSFDDRAAYLAGAPLRLAGLDANERGADSLAEEFESREDVATASAVLRTSVRYELTDRNLVEVELLGLDPAELPDVAWFRDDLADESLTALLAPLRDQPLELASVVLPTDAERLGIWAHLTRASSVIVALRVLDSQGRYVDLRLEPTLDGGIGWHLLSASLDDLAPGSAAVTGIFVRRAPRFGSFANQIVFDDLQYSPTMGPLGEPFEDGVVVEDFESLERWAPVFEASATGRADRFNAERELVRSGLAAARYTWERNLQVPRGISLAGDGLPLAVIANQVFLDEAELRVGDEVQVFATQGPMLVRIEGAFDLFPTFDPRDGNAMLLADGERLRFFLNGEGTRFGVVAPNEIWIEPGGDPEIASLREAIDVGTFGDVTVFDTAALRDAQNEDPLTAAGWDGLLFLSFSSVLLLSALGFLVSSLISARTRALEFAILRTLGFSLRQTLAVVAFEKILIVVLAMAVGTLVGARLGILMLEFLGITERGVEVVPPFVLATDWGTIGVVYGILGAVFLLAVGVVVALYARLALYRVLRVGE